MSVRYFTFRYKMEHALSAFGLVLIHIAFWLSWKPVTLQPESLCFLPNTGSKNDRRCVVFDYTSRFSGIWSFYTIFSYTKRQTISFHVSRCFDCGICLWLGRFTSTYCNTDKLCAGSGSWPKVWQYPLLTLGSDKFFTKNTNKNRVTIHLLHTRNQDSSPTRQLTDTVFETIHRRIFRQLTDTL